MIISCILAGGVGQRMKKDIPKQFINICDVPVIIILLRKVLQCECIDKIVVAIHPSWKDYFKEILVKYDIDSSKIVIVEGGETRFDTLCNSIEKSYEIDPHSKVLVHNAAAPFTSYEIISRAIKELDNCDIVETANPAVDGVLQTDGTNQITTFLNRSQIYYAVGPQCFYSAQFLELLNKTPIEKRKEYMEACKLFLDNGLKANFIQSDRTNFKITTDFDLIVAEGLVKSKKIDLEGVNTK